MPAAAAGDLDHDLRRTANGGRLDARADPAARCAKLPCSRGCGASLDDPVAGIEEALAPLDEDAVDREGWTHAVLPVRGGALQAGRRAQPAAASDQRARRRPGSRCSRTWCTTWSSGWRSCAACTGPWPDRLASRPRWRVSVAIWAFEATSAARCSSLECPFVSAGMPATSPATNAPGARPARRAGSDGRKRFAAAHPQGQTHPIPSGRPRARRSLIVAAVLGCTDRIRQRGADELRRRLMARPCALEQRGLHAAKIDADQLS